jgi:hypothetical protein
MEFPNVYKLTQLIPEPTRSTASFESLIDLLIHENPHDVLKGISVSGVGNHSVVSKMMN